MLAVILGGAAVLLERASGATLVPAGSVWKYLDTGIDPGPGWTLRDFDDHSWLSGPAQLGYGEFDEATVVGFGPDPRNKFITTYFRHSWVLTNAAQYSNLSLRLLRDDGAVVYLNGIAVAMAGMPYGPITASTRAMECAIEGKLFVTPPLTLMPGLLVDGTNVLAVEIHQVNPSSTDISFDLELTDEPAEVTGFVDLPGPATFTAPARLSLMTKAASPAGVKRVQFLVNGAKQDEREMYNNLYASFACSFDAPTNCALTLTSHDNRGLVRTSSVDIVVEPDPNPAATATLVRTGAEWKYLDDRSDQGTAWRSPDYDDGLWKVGPAVLGYSGQGVATPLDNDTIAAFFRHTWDVPDPSIFRALVLRVLLRDGVKVYLNGSDAFRNNLPSEPVNSTTHAIEARQSADYVSSAFIDASLLVPGRNLIAAETHCARTGSSGLMFDLELLGLMAAQAPVLSIQLASPGSVVLSWPDPASGYQLMETPRLNPADWTPVTTTPVSAAGRLQVTVQPEGAARFYRLSGQ